jgi:cell division protease FtsH
MFLPEEDRYSHSKEHLESQISSLFGGRIAEELIFGGHSVTTGASNDIQRATDIARNMVTKWGLSDRMGPLAYGEDEGEVFLGRSVTQHKALSDDTAHAIDEEVRAFIDRNYDRARQILEDHTDRLHAMADALMKYETIDSDQIRDIMEGRDPRPPKQWGDDATQPPSGSADAPATLKPDTETRPSSGSIGGPAGEH